MTPEQQHAIAQEVETRDGSRRLSCHKAFQLAGKLGLSLADLGKYCEEEKIKISSCQLGCF